MKSNKLKIGRSRIVVNPILPSFLNDPAVKRKAERAEATLKKIYEHMGPVEWEKIFGKRTEENQD